MSWLSRNRLPYIKEYRSYSVTSIPGQDRQDVDHGGKIILPPSALEALTRLNTPYPMLFKLTNSSKNRQTHCGVLEFIADAGRVYIPSWLMRNLQLQDGNPVQIQSVTLPIANFSKFQPQSSEFLDISNPKAVLENELRHFACLTSGDTIVIRYNDKNYELKVLETKPSDAVSIIECDMDVDFAPPADYVEPVVGPVDQKDQDPDPAFRTFGGSGNRLDGKFAELLEGSGQERARGVPDYDFQTGSITFVRKIGPDLGNPGEKTKEEFKAFTGKGESLAVPKIKSTPNPEIIQEINEINNEETVAPSSQANTPFVDLDDEDFNFFWDYSTPSLGPLEEETTNENRRRSRSRSRADVEE